MVVIMDTSFLYDVTPCSLVEVYHHLADSTAFIVRVDIYKAGTSEKLEHFYQTTGLHILDGSKRHIFLVIIFTCNLLY